MCEQREETPAILPLSKVLLICAGIHARPHGVRELNCQSWFLCDLRPATVPAHPQVLAMARRSVGRDAREMWQLAVG